MVKCPYCNELIDDDSSYCDQCGGLLYVCPRCHKIGRGKGKRCGACGSPLVSAAEQSTQDPLQGSGNGSGANGSPSSSVYPGTSFTDRNQSFGGQSSNNVGGSSQPGFGSSPSHNITNPGGGQSPWSHTEATDRPVQVSALVYPPMGIRLDLASGNVIGRTSGQYSQKLGQCIYISGTHARVDFDGRKWTITDLGSRNGTKVNGVRCSPTLSIKVGDTVRLGNYYDFKVV